MSSFNKAAAALSVFQTNKNATAVILEGAIVAYDTDFDDCTNVTGSAASSTIGVALNAAQIGERVNIGVLGIFPVLLAASTTVANGAPLMTAAATGTVTNITSTGYDVVGIAQGAHVSGSGGPEFINVLMTPGARR